jgi:hypothetical protein
MMLGEGIYFRFLNRHEFACFFGVLRAMTHPGSTQNEPRMTQNESRMNAEIRPLVVRFFVRWPIRGTGYSHTEPGGTTDETRTEHGGYPCSIGVQSAA